MKEIFKDVKGYEGRYQVSNLGNVYSTPKDGKPNKLLKQEIVKRNHTNYRRVSLSKEGKVKRFQVHQLVAIAFIPNSENKPHINHIDNNGENNNVNNLEWCTPQENMQHSAKQGRLDAATKAGGEANANKVKEKIIKKFTELLGDNLIEICPVDEDGRTYIRFYCKYCNSEHKSRTDSITANTGYCNSCRRRHKHIIKED